MDGEEFHIVFLSLFDTDVVVALGNLVRSLKELEEEPPQGECDTPWI